VSLKDFNLGSKLSASSLKPPSWNPHFLSKDTYVSSTEMNEPI
jgi:hypothetical protein